MIVEITQDAVNATIDPRELARIAGEARDEFDVLIAEGGTEDALRVIYVRSAIAEHQSRLVAEWMDATRKTVEGFIGQLKDHPMLSMFGDNPFGG